MHESIAAARAKTEALIQRNPHGNFKEVEAKREKFEEDVKWHFTQTPKPDWKPGSGATDDEWKKHDTIEIDPYGEGRNPIDNYKLLISGIIPRPIGFISSISASGVKNLAPFSYTNMVNHDPPIFCVGFSGGRGQAKDTATNILETGECTLNIISEWFIEAANYTATNAPPDVSEWDLCGLTPAASSVVKPERVAESAFSIECKLVTHHEWESPTAAADGSRRKTGILCILQGVRFHVREDAINEARNTIKPEVLRPVARLGGITYGRVTQGFELPRPDFLKDKEEDEHVKEVAKKAGL